MSDSAQPAEVPSVEAAPGRKAFRPFFYIVSCAAMDMAMLGAAFLISFALREAFSRRIYALSPVRVVDRSGAGALYALGAFNTLAGLAYEGPRWLTGDSTILSSTPFRDCSPPPPGACRISAFWEISIRPRAGASAGAIFTSAIWPRRTAAPRACWTLATARRRSNGVSEAGLPYGNWSRRQKR